MTARPEAGFDAFLALLGRLNYVFTNTESLLIHLIAGLAHCDKETATVVFLTLNTTRARIDLVERLAKLERIPSAEREEVLALTREMLRLSGVRNHHNHCLYAFDPEDGSVRTILMRIADRKTRIELGRTSEIDAEAVKGMREAIEKLAALNAAMWRTAKMRGYPL